MKCLKCKNERFKEERVRFHPTVKGEEVDVVTTAFVCTKCWEPQMNDEQMDMLRRRQADVYRQQHDMLTSKEIRGHREGLNMSQREFAKYLGVGEASIKRWETYYIQDNSQDLLIRLKCDEQFAAESSLDLIRKKHEGDEYTGYVRLNLKRTKNLILYFLKWAKSPLYLNKVLFYVDFLHFKRHGKGITGMSYFAVEYGPAPYRYDTYYRPLLRDEDIEKEGNHNLRRNTKPDMDIFGSKELETIETIRDELRKANGARKLLDRSHTEEAYLRTEENDLISYSLAEYLSFQ